LRVLRSVFKKYDHNQNLQIEQAELRSLCYDLGFWLSEYEAKLIFSQLNKGDPRYITFDTFATWWRSNDKFRKLDESKGDFYQECIAYFRYFDSDDGGTITRDEYLHLHKDLQKNGHLTNLSVEEGLKFLDKNGDGIIQFSEFLDFLDSVS